MRYLPHTEADVRYMLDAIGVDSFEDVVAAIPEPLRQFNLEEPQRIGEPDLMRHYAAMQTGCDVRASFLGAGLYRHFVPCAVDSLISRGEFLTAYTPYQPEVAQGSLQAVFEFQTMVSEMLGLEVANASMYDGASATAEAALMALRLQKKKRRLLISEGLHPEYREVVDTYLKSVDCSLETVPLEGGALDPDALESALGSDVAGVIIQSPNVLGVVEDLTCLGSAIHEAGAKFITVCNSPTSLSLFKSPGACGADIAVGEGTGIGVLPSFGGPGVGLFASRKEYLRQMPGRLCGQALDADGNEGYVLTLSTREQHIRREKATSNICTNQGLMALAFAIHGTLLGKRGFVDLGTQCAQRARYLQSALAARGVSRRYPDTPYYNEFVVEMGDRVEAAINLGLERKIVAGLDLGRWNPKWSGGLMICVNEMQSRAVMDDLVDLLVEVSQ